MRDLEQSPVSTAPSVNIPTPTRPVASVPYSIPIPPVSNTHTSHVGEASQTPTTPRISTPIPHPNASAATPYLSSLPPSTIPNNTLLHFITYEQFLSDELPIPTSQLHPSYVQSSLARRKRGPVLRYHPYPWTRTQTQLAYASRQRYVIRDLTTSRQPNCTRPQ